MTKNIKTIFKTPHPQIPENAYCHTIHYIISTVSSTSLTVKIQEKTTNLYIVEIVKCLSEILRKYSPELRALK